MKFCGKIFIAIFLIVLIGIFFFSMDYFDNHPSLIILVAIFAIIISSLYTTIQIELRNKQYIIDNRPSVFHKGEIDVKSYSNKLVFIMPLANVGKLPAKFDLIETKIKLGKIEENIKPPSGNMVIFPTHILFLHISISKGQESQAIKEEGLTLKTLITYYSINDVKKEHKFNYYTEIKFPLDKNLSTSTTFFSKEHILLKIDAE